MSNDNGKWPRKPYSIERPNCEQAHSMSAAQCRDPDCTGLHLIGWREDDTAICEIVMSRRMLGDLIELAKELGIYP